MNKPIIRLCSSDAFAFLELSSCVVYRTRVHVQERTSSADGININPIVCFLIG